MIKNIVLSILLVFSGVVSAETYGSITIYGPGYYGSYQHLPSYNHRQVRPHYPNMYPHRGYVEPIRRPDPIYKSPDYYYERSSCYPYPIYDQYGRLMYYQTRCN